MHVPTGLFASLMLGEKELDSGADADFWYLQAGIERKWFDYGATTLYGEYGQYNDVATRRWMGKGSSLLTAVKRSVSASASCSTSIARRWTSSRRRRSGTSSLKAQKKKT